MTHVPPGVPRENVQLDLDRPHMEILHVEETKAFQVMAGVTHAEYEALETEPPYVKIGVGFAAMDEGYFSRSPGADADGRERTQMAFFTATFSVMGHLAKADGRVSANEIRVANSVME